LFRENIIRLKVCAIFRIILLDNNVVDAGALEGGGGQGEGGRVEAA
jgi:hypothetical protein